MEAKEAGAQTSGFLRHLRSAKNFQLKRATLKNTIHTEKSHVATQHANGDTTLTFKRPMNGAMGCMLVIGFFVLLFCLLIAIAAMSGNNTGGFGMLFLGVTLVVGFVLYRLKLSFTTMSVKVVANQGLKTMSGDVPFADIRGFDTATESNTTYARALTDKGPARICVVDNSGGTEVIATLEQYWRAWTKSNMAT